MINIFNNTIFYHFVTVWCSNTKNTYNISYIGIDTSPSITDIKNEFVKLKKEYFDFCKKKVKMLEPRLTQKVTCFFSSRFEKDFINKLKILVLEKSEIILNWPIDLIKLIDDFTRLNIIEKEWSEIKQEKFKEVEKIFTIFQKNKSFSDFSTGDLHSYYDIANNVIDTVKEEVFIEITKITCFYISSNYHLLNIIRFYNKGGRILNESAKADYNGTSFYAERSKNNIDIKTRTHNYDLKGRAIFILGSLKIKLPMLTTSEIDFEDFNKRKITTKSQYYPENIDFYEINLLNCNNLKGIIKEAFLQVQKTDKTSTYLLIEFNLFNLQKNQKTRKNILKKLENILNIIQEVKNKPKYRYTKIIFIFYPKYDEYYANKVSESPKLYNTISQDLYETLVSKLNDFIPENKIIKYERSESPLCYKGGLKNIEDVLNAIL